MSEVFAEIEFDKAVNALADYAETFPTDEWNANSTPPSMYFRFVVKVSFAYYTNSKKLLITKG